MIKITNGTDVKEVTSGMYKSLYSFMGYKPVGTKREPKQVVKEPEKVIEVEKKDIEEVKEIKKDSPKPSKK